MSDETSAEVRLVNALCDAKRAVLDMVEREPMQWFVLYCKVGLLFWKTRRTIEKRIGVEIACPNEAQNEP